jgi:type VI protein secretion system component VasK
MKHFFPMRKGEAMLLVFLIAMAAISFLPMWRTMEVGGMAVFGWLMAALMITAPLLALLVFRRADRSKINKNNRDATEIKIIENKSPESNSKEEPKT